MSRGCLHWYIFHKSGFKSTPVVLPYPAMHLLVEELMNVSQGESQFYGGDDDQQWSCEDPSLTSGYDKLASAPARPKERFYTKILIPKGGGQFILVILANGSH